MNTIKRINQDTMTEFAEKIEFAKEHFIPMLPFVKMPFHDFDRYKFFSDKGIYLVDTIRNDYCLYHLYHLSEGDDTLRATLILPSNWDRRFEIIEESIANIKEWFFKEDQSKKLIIQSLEYGEVEYFPTLSHYLIPTIIRNGFEPKYRMYMRRDSNQPTNDTSSLSDNLREANYSKELHEHITDFYFHSEITKNYRYFTNCTFEEFQNIFQQEFSIKNSRFITASDGSIIAGIIVSRDSGKVWIDNFTVSPQYDPCVGEYLLNKTIEQLAKVCPDEAIYIYVNRDCRDAVTACERNNFVPFEFWTDMILAR